MTEAEWLACADPEAMLEFLTNKVRDRKLRLFAVAYCRRLWHCLSVELREAVEVAERFADRAVSRDVFTQMRSVIEDATDSSPLDGILYDAVGVALYSEDMPFLKCHVTLKVGSDSAAEAEGWHREGQNPEAQAEAKVAHAALIRDIFGNPFRPVAADPKWLTSTVVALARQMYDSRDFSPLPILADALQDAGCEDEAILSHCRGEGPHVRGCFVIDLLLGKA